MAKIKPIDETISKDIRELLMQELRDINKIDLSLEEHLLQELRNINKTDLSLSLEEHLSKEESRKLFYKIRYD